MTEFVIAFAALCGLAFAAHRAWYGPQPLFGRACLVLFFMATATLLHAQRFPTGAASGWATLAVGLFLLSALTLLGMMLVSAHWMLKRVRQTNR